MIRHTNFFILLVLFFSCKEISEKKEDVFFQENIEKVNKQASKNDIPINTDTLTDLTGTWVCYKYTSDSRVTKKYSENYAREFSTFSKLEISKENIRIGECIKSIYTYKYPTTLKKYEDESPFVTFFKPKNMLSPKIRTRI